MNTDKKFTRTLEQAKEKLSIVQLQEKEFNIEASYNRKQIKQLEIKNRKLAKKISSHMKYMNYLNEEIKQKEVLLVSEPVKEKVEVEIRYHTFGAGLVVIDTNKVISEDKFPAIKKAIEWELNEVENLDKINTGNYISNLNTNDTEKELERGFTIITSKQSPPPFELKEGKDWEIQSFLNTSQRIILKNEGDGYFKEKKHHGGTQLSILLKMPNMAIYSVKRLSDNTVWKIGDKVEYGAISMEIATQMKLKQTAIASFKINECSIWAYGDNFFISPLSHLRKPSPEKLQITDHPTQPNNP